MPQLSRKVRRAFVFFFLLLFFLVCALPFRAAKIWNPFLSFFRLGDFSSCADSSPFSVHVLDVGKADSILVECENHFMLIDGGTPECGKKVVRYLNRRGVSKLDYIINTHPDEDHIGGLKSVISSVGTVHFFAPQILPEFVPSDSAYLDTMQALKEAELSAESPKAGDEFSLGDAKFLVLGPVCPGNSTNNSSIVLMISYHNVRFLMMGDAEKEEEDSLLASGCNLTADVLKVGHHGSNTSSTEAFLKDVQPKYAVISVGYDRNKLPKNDVLKRLFQVGAKTYRTDISGTVIFLSDGKNISVQTEK